MVGRSILVGKPVAQLLLAENCTVTVAHSRTRDLAAKVAAADIVVAAVGQAEMIKGDWIKPGATVIDVGINRVERGGKTTLVGRRRVRRSLADTRAPSRRCPAGWAR